MTHAAAVGPSGWAWVAMAVSVLLLAGLSVGAYLLLFRDSGRSARHPTARRWLAGQLARGQITAQEYRHLIAALDANKHGCIPTSTPHFAHLGQTGRSVQHRHHDRRGRLKRRRRLSRPRRVADPAAPPL